MLLSTFQWIEQTGLSKAINESLYAFAYIQAVHLLALAVLGGAALVVDLRLMGLVMTDQAVAALERVVRPWFTWSLITILVTGLLLFVSLAAGKYYGHYYFWVKMYFLAGALMFTYVIRNRVARGDAGRADSMVGRLVGFVSVFLWSGVAFAGKAIGYIS